jgi:NADH-quinone oxidoreductase subunit K
MDSFIYFLLSFNFVYNLFFFSITLFVTGILGIFVIRQDLVVMLISIELIFLSSVINFILFGIYYDNLEGEIFAMFILALAASESAVILSIIVVYYQVLSISDINFFEITIK